MNRKLLMLGLIFVLCVSCTNKQENNELILATNFDDLDADMVASTIISTKTTNNGQTNLEKQNLNLNDYKYTFFIDESGFLTINKIDSENVSEPFTTIYLPETPFQASLDKTKLLILVKSSNAGKKSMFYIDLNDNSIKLISQYVWDAILSKNGQYVFATKEPRTNKFYLFNLEDNKEVSYTWKLENEEKWKEYWSDYALYRCIEDLNYDFMITFSHEQVCIAQSYFNIDSGEFFTVFDDSNKAEYQLRSGIVTEAEHSGNVSYEEIDFSVVK